MGGVNTITVAEAVGKGVYSVPETLLEGLKRSGESLEFWNQDMMNKIGGENERAFKLLIKFGKSVLNGTNSPLNKAIEIIVRHFLNVLPEEEL